MPSTASPEGVLGLTSMGPKFLFPLLLATLAIGQPAAAVPPNLRLPDLDNRLVDPFAAPPGTAIAFLFVSVECPISNRYAPEIRRLHDAFTPRGVSFRIVYPNPAESPGTIRRHMKEYDLPGMALRDPRQELAKFAGATITPEAAVYGKDGKRLYLGRIDDRYVSLGVQRPAATRHDLDAALADTVAGRRVRQAAAPAVGCFIADFSR
jgi:hypothetical protein